MRETKPILYANLETAYENWCIKHGISRTEFSRRIRIVDPITGESISTKKVHAGKLALSELVDKPEVKKEPEKQPEQPHGKSNIDGERTLEEFSDVSKR